MSKISLHFSVLAGNIRDEFAVDSFHRQSLRRVPDETFINDSAVEDRREPLFDSHSAQAELRRIAALRGTYTSLCGTRGRTRSVQSKRAAP